MTADDFLIENGGRLDPAWLEPHNASTLLTKYLAAAQPGDDALVAARVYHRAFTTAADLLIAQPAQQRDRDKSDAYLPDQLKMWRAIAEEYEREIDRLEGNALGPILTAWEGDPICGS